MGVRKICDLPAGDNGQRYELRATGWPKPGAKHTVAYFEKLEAATATAASIRKAPSCISTEVYDRQKSKVVSYIEK